MNLIQAFVEVALVASGLFFLGVALLDGRRAARPAVERDGPQVPGTARGGATLLPRTIRRTALD